MIQRTYGDVIYLTFEHLASEYLSHIANVDGDIEARASALRASTTAHSALNTLNGMPSHSLGTAISRAEVVLFKTEKTAIKQVQHKANSARHVWDAPEDDGGILAGLEGEFA